MTLSGLALAMAAATAQTSGVEVTIDGPLAPLAGTFEPATTATAKRTVAVIIPGSGPTDRDGNNPLGVKAQSYRLLAQALARNGIASIRFDKRGMFASRKAIADPNAVTIADYAADAQTWARLAAQRAGARCAWLVGHSEGGLVALKAAQDPKGLCGIILLASPGRPIGTVMREQFKANPANAPILAPALAMLDNLEAGQTIAPSELPAPLNQMFPLPVQRFLIDTMKLDPAALARSAKVPVIVVQGAEDMQVSVADARVLAGSRRNIPLHVLPGVNHVLKQVPVGDRAANMRSYSDPDLPVAQSVVDAVVAAMAKPKRKRP